ncbi:MAG: O-antigen ligase family protein [Alicyclobacillus sp.]|nr:O-antigen ligase family protein [Alicyclobacillus sp.]
MDGQATVPGLTSTSAGVSAANPGTSRWAKWSLYGLMAFPIVDFGLRMHPLHPLGAIWDKLVFIILAVLAIARYLSGFRPGWFNWHKVGMWYVIFALGMMFAGMATPVVSVEGFRFDVYYIFFAYLIPFVVGPEDVEVMLHIGAMTAILISIDGIYQYITAAPMPAGWVDPTQHVRTRVYSVLTSPNELGAYMALMTPLIAGLALYTPSGWRKWLYLGGTLTCLMTLLFTFTRGAWVSLALAALLVALLVERRLFLVLVVVGVIGYFLPPIHHRIGELLTPVYWMKSATAGGRIAKWLTAFDRMSSDPLFGVGLGHYGGAVASDFHSSTYSDNYYAKLLGESGLVGLTLFLSFHVALVRDLFRHVLRFARGRARFAVIGAIIGLVAVLIHNAMENVFEYGPNAASYFVYASLLFVWGRGMKKEAQHETTEPPAR